ESPAGDLPISEHRSGVVDQHVQPLIAPAELVRGPARLRDELQIRADRVRADLSLDRVELRRVAADHHHGGAGALQLACGDPADPGSPAGDQHHLAVHPRPRWRARSISRFASRSAMVSRLSTPVFPLQTPSSTFTIPSLKYRLSGISE